MIIIPDISHYNPIRDWSVLNAKFLICKATEGTGYVDPTLSGFIRGCEAREIPYWLYAYLDKGSELEQTQFLIKTCKDKVGTNFMGYVLDIEAGNAVSGCKAAMDYLAKLGSKFMIYTGYADYNRYSSLINNRPGNCAWWEARYGLNDGIYTDKYPCHKGADLHQFTSKGSFPGLAKTRTDLSRLTGKKPLDWFTDRTIDPGYSKVRSGIVTTDLYLRTGPGTVFPSLEVIPEGTTVQIIGTADNANGKPWHKIIYKNKYGFVSGKHVKE